MEHIAMDVLIFKRVRCCDYVIIVICVCEYILLESLSVYVRLEFLKNIQGVKYAVKIFQKLIKLG